MEGVVGKKNTYASYALGKAAQKRTCAHKRRRGPKIIVRFLRISWKTPHVNINLKFSWKFQGVLKGSIRRNGLSSNNK